MNEIPPLPPKVRALMEQAIQERVFPGAVITAGEGDRILINAGFGRCTYGSTAWPVSPDTVYDIASLTKVIATTTAAMLLFEQGRLKLDEVIADSLLEFRASSQKVTVRHLLAHTSGLPAYCPYYRESNSKQALLAQAFKTPLEAEPGARILYSDPGFILLGAFLERIAGEPLDILFRSKIGEPLGLSRTRFKPSRSLRPFIAPTEHDRDFRKRLIHGEVHDENAWVMGGVAGQAGLFSVGLDLARFGQMMLQEGTSRAGRFLKRETVRRFLERQGPEGRRLGWDVPTPGGATGRHFSADSFGHLGYTGASFWIDPKRNFFVIVLNNRVHPSRENKRIMQFRPRIHDALLEEFLGKQ